MSTPAATLATERQLLQLVLDVDDDELTWHDWFRSLPVTPGAETTVGERLDAREEAGA